MYNGVERRASALPTGVFKPRARIALVEENALLREGLTALLNSQGDFHVVGDYATLATCMERIRGLQPDLVLTDIASADRSEVDLIGEIKRVSPMTRALVLAAHDDEDLIRAALRAGANGYILKAANVADLILAIRVVATGQQFLCRASASRILADYLSAGTHARPAAPAAESPALLQRITEREREVLTRIAMGNSNKLIARDLGVSPKTVEKHRSNLMRKLQLHNAAAITMFAIRNGLTDGGDQNPSGRRSPGARRPGRESQLLSGAVQWPDGRAAPPASSLTGWGVALHDGEQNPDRRP